MFEAEFWVAVATILFVLLLGYMGVHRKLLEALDARRAAIEAELDQARRLKTEAQQLVEQYRRKQEEAQAEADLLIAGARAEAERYASETHAKMDELVARRTKMAETKIAQAEAQALAEVRSAAADAAVGAAADILQHSTKGRVADDLIARGIADVQAKLN